eukprot:scaffold275986_cov28-Tisochrysis_lutea.AAC.4
MTLVEVGVGRVGLLISGDDEQFERDADGQAKGRNAGHSSASALGLGKSLPRITVDELNQCVKLTTCPHRVPT